MINSVIAVVLAPPVIFSESFQSRLENWRRWLTSGGSVGRCGSAEGNYRPPPCWHPPEPRVGIDLADALKVNEAWQELVMPEKQMVKFAMVYKEHWRATCRKLRIGSEQYDSMLERSLTNLRNNLTFVRNSEECSFRPHRRVLEPPGSVSIGVTE